MKRKIQNFGGKILVEPDNTFMSKSMEEEGKQSMSMMPLKFLFEKNGIFIRISQGNL